MKSVEGMEKCSLLCINGNLSILQQLWKSANRVIQPRYCYFCSLCGTDGTEVPLRALLNSRATSSLSGRWHLARGALPRGARLLLGSVTQRLLHFAHYPVLVVP